MEQDCIVPLLGTTSVSSAEIVRQFGRWQDHATIEPVFVTHHGRARVVLVSATRYQQLAATSITDGPGDGLQHDEVLDQLMEHLEQGFIAFRRDMTITAINQAACNFFKVHRDTMLGHRLEERLPAVRDSLGFVSLRRAAESGAMSTFEMPSFAYPGRWLLMQMFPLRDGAAALFRDITDELEARREVDAKTATLAALAAHGGIGRAELSVRGTFTRIDEALAGFAGFAPEALARARLTDILALRSRAAAADAVEAVLDGGAARSLDVRILAKTGAERDVRIGLAALRSQSGASGLVAVVTERPVAAA